MSVQRTALLLVLVGMFTLAPMASSQATEDADVVRVIIDDVVSQGTTLHVERALGIAEELRVPLLLELNTPGGLVQATLDMDDLLAQADVPVLTYVGPGGGAYAASAGTFILLMGHQSGMANGSTIGSAQAVQSGADGSTAPASDKVQNFLVERIRSIAERNGRDADLAERFITENLNMNASVALDAGLIDAVGDDASAFLDAIHGTNLLVGARSITLDTQGAVIRDVGPGTMASVVDFLGNPQVAFVLVLAGTYGVVFGVTNGGTYVPEVIGAILLILGFIGLGLFGTTTAGIVLLILALLFFVTEVFTPTNGILTGAGVVAMVFAAIFILDEPLFPQSARNWFVGTGIGLSIAFGALTFLAVTLALRTNNRPTHDAIIGHQAVVVDRLAPTGRVEVNGEIWYAETDIGPLEAGQTVDIVGREGLRLHVSPSEPSPSADT